MLAKETTQMRMYRGYADSQILSDLLLLLAGQKPAHDRTFAFSKILPLLRGGGQPGPHISRNRQAAMKHELSVGWDFVEWYEVIQKSSSARAQRVKKQTEFRFSVEQNDEKPGNQKMESPRAFQPGHVRELEINKHQAGWLAWNGFESCVTARIRGGDVKIL